MAPVHRIDFNGVGNGKSRRDAIGCARVHVDCPCKMGRLLTKEETKERRRGGNVTSRASSINMFSCFSLFGNPAEGWCSFYTSFLSSFPALVTPRHVCCRCFPLFLVSLKLLVGQVLQHLHGRQGVRHQPKEDKGNENREGGEVVRE